MSHNPIRSTFFLFAMTLTTLAFIGCGEESTSPSDSSSTSSKQSSESKAQAAAQWAEEKTSPESGTAKTAAQAVMPGADGAASVVGLRFNPHPEWKSSPPSNPMRQAQYALPGDAGDAELVLFFFGVGAGGGTQMNLERWAGQMGTTMDQAEVSEQEVNGCKISTMAVSGAYSGMGQGEGLADFRMIASVIEGEGGPWFFKLVGPEATVQAWADAYNAMLSSVGKSSS